MPTSKNPGLTGFYNFISFGLFKFYWINKTLNEIKSEKIGFDFKTAFAKICLWTYLGLSLLVPIVTTYLMTIEVIEKDGSRHYGVIGKGLSLILSSLWQIPAAVAILLTLIAFKEYADKKAKVVNHLMLTSLALGSIFGEWVARYFAQNTFIITLVLMSIFLAVFQSEKNKAMAIATN